MTYRREIDGLRAIAVLSVIFFHAGFEIFSGGFVGVDVFFVISGYLITSIILSELAVGSFSLKNFYEKRARRILPALFFVMFVCLPFGLLMMMPAQAKQFSLSLIAIAIFGSNILFWRESGYFDLAAESKPLLHTWSLSIEEQYYLIFPLFMMLFWKFGRRWLLFVLVLIFIISFSTAELMSYKKPVAAFFLLPTRAWELLLGAFCAFYLAPGRRLATRKNLREIFGWLGIFLILFSVFSYSRITPGPGLYTLAPTLGALLIILFANEGTAIGLLLGSPALVGIGLMSYSLYLWHQPLFAFTRIYTFDQISLALKLVLISVTFILSFVSLRFIEKPFRVAGKVKRRSVVGLALICSLSLVLIGCLGYWRATSFFKYPELASAVDDWYYPGELSQTKIDGYHKRDTNAPVHTLFFGDSHAEQLAPIAKELGASGFNVGFLTGGGCPPIPDVVDESHSHCFDLFDRLARVLRIETQIKNIVIAGCFNCYFLSDNAERTNKEESVDYYVRRSDENLVLRTPRGQRSALNYFSSFLDNISSKYRVVVLGDNPLHSSFDPSNMMAFRLRGESKFFKSRHKDFRPGEFETPLAQVELERRIKASLNEKVSFLSLAGLVCPDGVCRALDGNGNPIYKDSNHLRPISVNRLVAPHILTLLK